VRRKGIEITAATTATTTTKMKPVKWDEEAEEANKQLANQLAEREAAKREAKWEAKRAEREAMRAEREAKREAKRAEQEAKRAEHAEKAKREAEWESRSSVRSPSTPKQTRPSGQALRDVLNSLPKSSAMEVDDEDDSEKDEVVQEEGASDDTPWFPSSDPMSSLSHVAVGIKLSVIWEENGDMYPAEVVAMVPGGSCVSLKYDDNYTDTKDLGKDRFVILCDDCLDKDEKAQATKAYQDLTGRERDFCLCSDCDTAHFGETDFSNLKDPSKKELLKVARGSVNDLYNPENFSSFGPHSGSCTPPKDWDRQGSNLNPTLIRVQSRFESFLEIASKMPTRSGNPAVFISPWLPWYVPNLTKVMILWLHFCPSSLENVLKGRSPAGATWNESTTTLISSTWQLIHLAMGPAYWATVKLNIVPFQFPYGGKPTDVFSKENHTLIMKEYCGFIIDAIDLADKSQFCSIGVREKFKMLLGGEVEHAKFIEDNESKFVSPVPPVHPERILNAAFHVPNVFERECMHFDVVYTDCCKCLGLGGESTVGANIFNGIEGSDAYEHKKEAARQSLGRARDVLLMAWIAWWDGCPTDEQYRIITAILDNLKRGREWQRKAREAYRDGKADETQKEYVQGQLKHLEWMRQAWEAYWNGEADETQKKYVQGQLEHCARRSASLNATIGLTITSARTLRSSVRTYCRVCGHEENTRGTVPANEDTVRIERREIEVFVGVDSPTGKPLKFTSGYYDAIAALGAPKNAFLKALKTEGGGVVEVKLGTQKQPKGTKWYIRNTPLPDRLCVIGTCRKCKARYDASKGSAGAPAPTMELVDMSHYSWTTTLQIIRRRASS